MNYKISFFLISSILCSGASAKIYRVLDDHIQRNIALISANQNKIQKEVDEKTANAQFLPYVNVYAQFDSFDNARTQVVADDTTDKQAGLHVNWNIFRSFADIQELQAARKDSEAAKFFKKSQRFYVEKEVFKLLSGYKVNFETTRAYRKKLEDLFSLKSITEKRIKSKASMQSNRDRVQVEIINTHNKLNELKKANYLYESQILSLTSVENLKDLDWPWYEEVKNLKYEKLSAYKSNTKHIPYMKFLELSEYSANKRVNVERLKQYGGIDLDVKRWASYLDGQNTWQTEFSLTYNIPLYAKNEFNSKIQESVNKKVITKQQKNNFKRLIEKRLSQVDFDLDVSIKNFEEQLKIVKLAERLFSKSKSQFVKGIVNHNERSLSDLDRLVQTKEYFYQSQRALILSMLDKCHFNGLDYRECLPK
jgi:outer membrane protein TolC